MPVPPALSGPFAASLLRSDLSTRNSLWTRFAALLPLRRFKICYAYLTLCVCVCQELFFTMGGQIVGAVRSFRCPNGGMCGIRRRGDGKGTADGGPSACQKTTVIANQPAGWCTPGWSLLPFGQFTSWRSPGFEGNVQVYELKMLQLSGRFPRQCAHWLGMTTFLTVSKIPQAKACGIFAFLISRGS